MKFRDWLIILMSFGLAVSLLTTASLRLDSIRQAREEMGLVANTSLENAPPSLAFATVAMGAFRGLIVDILWMRADNLKQEGKFFDAKQLAEWITILQPRFAAVWDFHAWNMAYNISVAIPNTRPEERWHWVKNGYELLRDRGIELNPNSILLYRSLAWIFQHKIGGISDDCHRFYKRELALSMRSLLGEEPTNEDFQALSKTPTDIKQILKDPKIAEFVEELKKADDAFSDLERLSGVYLSLRSTPGRFNKGAFAVIDLWRGTETLDTFDRYARAWRLRNEWKFDIDLMIELNNKYGPSEFEDPNNRMPLNWEHPGAHAIYWASKGLKVAGRPEEYRVDEKNTDRVVFHGLQMLFRNGTVVLYDEPREKPSIYLLPDLRMFRSCDELWSKIIKKYETFEGGNPKAVRGGHKNFLENAILMFHQSGFHKAGQILYQRLGKEHLIDPAGYERTEYKVPYEAFVQNRLKEEFEGIGIQDAVEFILSALKDSYLLYAIHKDDLAAGRENMAQQVWTIHQEQMGYDEPDRMKLPPMDWFRFQAFVAFLNSPAYPEQMRRGLIGRIQLERPDLLEVLKDQEVKFIDQLRKQQEQQ